MGEGNKSSLQENSSNKCERNEGNGKLTLELHSNNCGRQGPSTEAKVSG